MRHTLGILALLASAPLTAGPPVAEAAPLDLGRLAPRLEAVANAARPATLGIGVRDLDSGRQVLLYGGQRFPLQSVFKLPLAIAVLDAADVGELSLEERIVIGPADISPGWSPMAEEIRRQGSLGLDIGELARRAQVVSDNTAADVLIERLGGMADVQARLSAKGLTGFRLDRDERALVPEVPGLAADPAWAEPGRLTEAVAALSDEALAQALDAHLADPRDTGTPGGLLDLLAAFERGDLLSPTSTALLRQWMLETRTGPGRLLAGLPEGWSLGHKTGSSASFRGRTPTANDVGIAYGPRGERIAIVVLLKDSHAPEAERDAHFAEVARAVAEVLDAAAARRGH